MSAAPGDQQAARPQEVFISYSRKDKEFVRRLDEELKRRDREAWVDWEGIPPGDTWEKTIYGAIEATHTFIFVLTPDSIASEVCGKEIAHAAANNKRLLPIVHRDVVADRVPKSLGELNWIFYRDSDDFKEATDTLIRALDTDLKWVRAHTRLLTRAIEWNANGKNNSFVLRGDDLRSAEQWLAQAGAEKERQPTALQTEYILASRKAATRRKQFTVLGVITLLVVAALGYLINENRRIRQRVAAELEQRQQILVEKGQRLRDNAKAVLANGRDDPTKDVTALRDLALALNLNPKDTEAAKIARNLLLRRVWCPPAASEVRYRRDTLLTAAFAPGGSNNEIFAAAGDGQLLFWNARELSTVRSLFDKPKPTEHEVMQPGFASFSPDGQWLCIIPPTLASADTTTKAAAQAPQQRAGTGGPAGSGHEVSKLQIWRWSQQKRTYESAGEDLEFQRLRGSRTMNFTWAPESDRFVLINTRLNEIECAFFQVKGNTFQEFLDRSNELNRMKIVALAFSRRLTTEKQSNSISGYKYRNAIAAVSVDSAVPGAVRKVSFIDEDDLQVIPNALHGQDSIRLTEGFQPDGIAFGPSNDQLTLTSWSGIRILDVREGTVTSMPPPTFHDQFMRIVVGPGDLATGLVAKSLYGRVEVAKGTRMQEPAESVVFGGSVGIAQFSVDGKRLLILSGGIWSVFDRMRLIDVSPLYRTLEPAPENFEEKPVPPWLADITAAVSALDVGGDGALLTLETVRKRYPKKSRAGDPYEAVWNRFFPEERTVH